MRDRRIGFMISAILGVALLFALAAPALGVPDVYTPEWSTGGYSGGTHQWATSRAVSMAAARGANWVDVGVAAGRSIYPDTVFRDNIDHNANWWGTYNSYYNSSWGHYFGNPQGKVQSYYNLTVAALRRGDRIEASKNLGYLSHYFIDINGPMHTQESATENDSFHGSLEDAAGSYDFSSYISDDGYQYRGDPGAFTVDCANHSHAYYSDLISAYGSGHSFNSTVKNIEGTNLNRGVNGLADIIQSAQDDAESVGAAIDAVSPSATTSGQPITFVGHGVDALHPIVAWRWRAEPGGVLSSASSFTTSTLSVGVHYIYFSAMCDQGTSSGEAFTPIIVGAEGTKPVAVYRFYNFKQGVHFFTASEEERHNVASTLSSTYNFEGVSYALDTSSTANNAPLHRFYNSRQGVHFYSADPAEIANVITTMGGTYRHEGEAYKVSLTAAPGAQPIYRFYNKPKGVHFFTADPAEVNSIITNLGAIYRYEGIAYYFDPPW